jgi:hypothetical protein
MDRVTRCLHCGKRMVPIACSSGPTELKCLFCDELDPMQTTAANKWADSPLAIPSLLNELARSKPSDVMSRYSISA